MRNEKDIKLGLIDAAQLAEDCLFDLQIAFKNKDWQTVFEKSSTINLVAISTMAINDSCFGNGLELGD